MTSVTWGRAVKIYEQKSLYTRPPSETYKNLYFKTKPIILCKKHMKTIKTYILIISEWNFFLRFVVRINPVLAISF